MILTWLTLREVKAASSAAPYRVFNVGNSRSVMLMEYIAALEQSLGIKAQKNFLPLQAGDVPATYADTSDLNRWIGFMPNTSVATGVAKFVQWFRTYYKTEK